MQYADAETVIRQLLLERAALMIWANDVHAVLSACEGLLVPVPSFPRGAIVGMAIGILVILFVVQQFGTRRIGTSFSPIITIWFIFNASVVRTTPPWLRLHW
jgi:K+ transporter